MQSNHIRRNKRAQADKIEPDHRLFVSRNIAKVPCQSYEEILH